MPIRTTALRRPLAAPVLAIRGIETSAGLDPNNVAAFVTGLTFARDGEFHGSMTPLTVEVAVVPEPASAALALLAAGGLWCSRRRVRARRPASSAARRS